MSKMTCKYGRTKGKCRKTSTNGLDGAVRTCRKFVCVPGNGTTPSDKCRRGYVLRCAKYLPSKGKSPRWGQRKGYAQYTYGRALPGNKTARERYSPAVGGKPLPNAEQLTRK